MGLIDKLDDQKVEDVYKRIYTDLSLVKSNYRKNIHSVNNLKCHFSMTLSYEKKYNRTFKDYRLNDFDQYEVMLCAIYKAIKNYKVRI